jgi:hypothetical protein
VTSDSDSGSGNVILTLALFRFCGGGGGGVPLQFEGKLPQQDVWGRGCARQTKSPDNTNLDIIAQIF